MHVACSLRCSYRPGPGLWFDGLCGRCVPARHTGRTDSPRIATASCLWLYISDVAELSDDLVTHNIASQCDPHETSADSVPIPSMHICIEYSKSASASLHGYCEQSFLVCLLPERNLFTGMHEVGKVSGRRAHPLHVNDMQARGREIKGAFGSMYPSCLAWDEQCLGRVRCRINRFSKHP
jgi:hypothetical protein